MSDADFKNKKSFQTKLIIMTAFTELIKKRNIEQITVKAITEKADISRGTFYLYFSDTEDVTNCIENFLLSEMPTAKSVNIRRTPKTRPEMPTLEECLDNEWEKAWFLYFQTHKEPLNALLGPHGHGQFYTKLKTQIMNELNTFMILDGFPDDNIRKYFQSLYADVFLILAQEWTLNKYKNNQDLQSLVDIASTIRIGGQYRTALFAQSGYERSQP